VDEREEREVRWHAETDGYFHAAVCGGAAFCTDGVEKRESLGTRDEAEALIPMPSMARKNIPASKTHIICAVFIGRPAIA